MQKTHGNGCGKSLKNIFPKCLQLTIFSIISPPPPPSEIPTHVLVCIVLVFQPRWMDEQNMFTHSGETKTKRIHKRAKRNYYEYLVSFVKRAHVCKSKK